MDQKEKHIPQEYLRYKSNDARNHVAVERAACAKEHKISMKCLDRNNFNKDLCEKEFENYKICRKFWHYLALDRHEKGLPLKMTEEEKIQAKLDFAKEIDEKAAYYKKKKERNDRFFKPS